ncbi:DNA polymerase [Streptomyces natalensis]|uniref:DNA polymerase n=1 Tax=Streptomyces natalensis TaxID=68242 RepID=UPI00099BEA4C|nr:DNA polymerase [Streptomyces natalensis]
MVEQYGVSEVEAKKAVKAFWETYPGVKRLAERLQREARRTGYIYTGTGRRLPVDRDRIYAALNYFIQSTSRDITARALIELDRAGYTEYIRLPIHDELVFSFPREQAAELAEKTARIMEMTVKGLLVPVDAEVGERSWGGDSGRCPPHPRSGDGHGLLGQGNASRGRCRWRRLGRRVTPGEAQEGCEPAPGDVVARWRATEGRKLRRCA